MMRVKKDFLLLLLLLLNGCAHAQDAQRVREVIYAKQGGVALTMDVFKPAKPNGIGVIWIVSGGWHSDHNDINPGIAQPFNDKGQTVFEVVHGTQPKYTILEIVPMVERAVRFVRAHAKEYGVDPNRIGVSGGSAGGHLSLMIGTQGAAGKPDAADPVDKASSAVQAVAVFFPPTDFLNYGETGHDVFLDVNKDTLNPYAAAFPVTGDTPKEERERLAKAESPMTFLTDKMPPTLIIHGGADTLVPPQQSKRFTDRLTELKVPNQLIIRDGKGHGWPEMGKEDFPLLADWFQKYLGEKKE